MQLMVGNWQGDEDHLSDLHTKKQKVLTDEMSITSYYDHKQTESSYR
jgi:hypothetical protein